MTDAVPGPVLIDRLLAELPTGGREHGALYLHERLQPAGDPQATPPGLPEPHWLAFADLQPGANWLHPALWLLTSQDLQRVTLVEASHPPAFGRLPAGWRLVWQSPRVESWQLMPTLERP